MKRLALLAAVVAASLAPPAHAGGPDEYSYGIDGYQTCTAAASSPSYVTYAHKMYLCTDRLVFELTDGGQLRRLPYCYAYAAEGVFSSPTSPLRRQFTCNETWLGTDLEPR